LDESQGILNEINEMGPDPLLWGYFFVALETIFEGKVIRDNKFGKVSKLTFHLLGNLDKFVLVKIHKSLWFEK
jgi:hypothetical protein